MKFENIFQIKITHLVEYNTPEDDVIREWAKVVMHNRCQAASLHIGLVDEKESAKFNQQYRNRLKPTNILSVPFELPTALLKRALPNNPEVFNFIGDLIICPPLIYKEAMKYKKPLDAHWAHLIIHGCLHLFGYNHTNVHDTSRMESLEIQYLAQFGYPDPY